MQHAVFFQSESRNRSSVLFIFYCLKTILTLNILWLYSSLAEVLPDALSRFLSIHLKILSQNQTNIQYKNKTPPNQENKRKQTPHKKIIFFNKVKAHKQENAESIIRCLGTLEHESCPRVIDIRSITPLEKAHFAFLARYKWHFSY